MQGKFKHLTLRKDKSAPLLEAHQPAKINTPTEAGQPMPVTVAEAPVPMAPVPLAVPEAADSMPSLPEPGQKPMSVAKPVPLSAWHLSGEAVIGLAHRRKGLPCQDAVTVRNAPRPILALSDGAGSAAVSELGAHALVSGITRFLMSLEDDLAPWLDKADATPPEQTARWTARLLRHAQGILDDLARSKRRSVRDLRGTLLLAIVGEHQTFWWQVGDGAIVVRHADGLRVLGNPASSKGEFANQTCFVDTADIGMVQHGILPTPEIVGLALMSDGGAEKLVAHDGRQVATRLCEWFDAVAKDSFPPDRIALAFHEPAMWERTSLDDRSVVLMARLASPD